jgi:hypothetical protein
MVIPTTTIDTVVMMRTSKNSLLRSPIVGLLGFIQDLKIASCFGVMEYRGIEIPNHNDQGFSVPRCRFASDGISASLQQVAVFLFPDT